MQSNHAVFKVGLQHHLKNAEDPSVVIVEIQDKKSLEKEINHLKSLGIETYSFYEPFDDIGLTAFATQPVTQEQRHLFSHYPLWGKKLELTKKIKKFESLDHRQFNQTIDHIHLNQQKSISKINHMRRNKDLDIDLSGISECIQNAQKLVKKLGKF